ncbi:hypothetical protein NEOLI_003920, partial [Neolecta irregularis DAH-3]
FPRSRITATSSADVNIETVPVKSEPSVLALPNSLVSIPKKSSQTKSFPQLNIKMQTMSTANVESDPPVTIFPFPNLPLSRITATSSADVKIETIPLKRESSVLGLPKSLVTAPKKSNRAKTILRQHLVATSRAHVVYGPQKTKAEAEANIEVETFRPIISLKSSAILKSSSFRLSGHALKEQKTPNPAMKTTAHSQSSSLVGENGDRLSKTGQAPAFTPGNFPRSMIVTQSAFTTIDIQDPEIKWPKTLTALAQSSNKVERPIGTQRSQTIFASAIAKSSVNPGVEFDIPTGIPETETKATTYAMASAKSKMVTFADAEFKSLLDEEENSEMPLRIQAVAKSRAQATFNTRPSLYSENFEEDLNMPPQAGTMAKTNARSMIITRPGSPRRSQVLEISEEDFEDSGDEDDSPALRLTRIFTKNQLQRNLQPQILPVAQKALGIAANQTGLLSSLRPLKTQSGIPHGLPLPVSPHVLAPLRMQFNSSRPTVSQNEPVPGIQKGPALPLLTSGSTKGRKSNSMKIYISALLAIAIGASVF